MKSLSRLLPLLFVPLFMMMHQNSKAQPFELYVNAAAEGMGNGSSWANAYTNLQDALAQASPGTNIYVAAGTYKPSEEADATASFVLKQGVALYGGFAGHEAPITQETIAQRNLQENPSILTGLLREESIASTEWRSWRVVYAADVDRTAVLDGFVIEESKRITYYQNEPDGAGYYGHWKANPTLRNLLFRGHNRSMINNEQCAPLVVNCTFLPFSPYSAHVENISINAPSFINCLFWTSEPTTGFAAWNRQGGQNLPSYEHCLLWRTPQAPAWEEKWGIGGEGNISGDPLLATEYSLLGLPFGELLKGSPAIGAGNTHYGTNIGYYQGPGAALPPHFLEEWLEWGQVHPKLPYLRQVNLFNVAVEGAVEITCTSQAVGLSLSPSGPFEGSVVVNTSHYKHKKHVPIYLQGVWEEGGPQFFELLLEDAATGEWLQSLGMEATVAAQRMIFVDDDARGTATGQDWKNAFTTLQQALSAVSNDGTIICMAQGTYFPEGTSEHIINNAIMLLGGFAGTETEITAQTLAGRDFARHTTIISADAAQNDGPGFTNRNDNHSFPLAVAVGASPNFCTLNGLTLQGGEAKPFDGGEGFFQGGGLSGSGRVMAQYLTLKDNNSQYYGTAAFQHLAPGSIIHHITFQDNKAEQLVLMAEWLTSFTTFDHLNVESGAGGLLFQRCKNLTLGHMAGISHIAFDRTYGTQLFNSTIRGHQPITILGSGEVTVANSVLLLPNFGGVPPLTPHPEKYLAFAGCILPGSGSGQEWKWGGAEDLGGNIDADPKLVPGHPYLPDPSSPLLGGGMPGLGTHIGYYQGAPAEKYHAFEDFLENLVTIYPNPTRGQVTFRLSPITKPIALSLVLLNAQGQQLWQQQYSHGVEGVALSYDMGHLPAGVYYLQATLQSITNPHSTTIPVLVQP